MISVLRNLLDPQKTATRHVCKYPGWGRVFPVMLLLVTLLIVAALAVFGWDLTWKFLGVHPMTPHFADMRTVQGGLESLSQGLDPQVENPGDPWGRRMNYPSVWLDLSKLLNLDIEANFITFVTLYLLIAALTIFYLNVHFPSLWMLLLSLSSAILLGFERGNNDLMVFILVATACFASRFLAIVLVIFSGLLKVFPLVAGIMFLDQWRSFAIFLIAAALAATYLLPELHQIRAGVPQMAGMSYGSGSLSEAAAIVGLDIPAFIFSVVLVVIALVFHVVFYSPATFGLSPRFSTEQRLFLSGSTIFLGTFLLSSNFDYRLVFLILCLPYVVARTGLMRHVTLALVLISANFGLMYEYLGHFGAVSNLMCKVTLFVCLAYYFLGIARPIVMSWFANAIAASSWHGR